MYLPSDNIKTKNIYIYQSKRVHINGYFRGHRSTEDVYNKGYYYNATVKRRERLESIYYTEERLDITCQSSKRKSKVPRCSWYTLNLIYFVWILQEFSDFVNKFYFES